MKKRLLISAIVLVVALLITGFVIPTYAYSPDGGGATSDNGEVCQVMHQACAEMMGGNMHQACEEMMGSGMMGGNMGSGMMGGGMMGGNMGRGMMGGAMMARGCH